jgi:hypothetical protein
MPYPPQGSGSGGGVSNHKLLSTVHLDTLPASVVIGDIIYGNSTPLWARLPAGSQNQILAMGPSLPAWTTQTLLSALHSDTSAGTAVAGDMIAANSVPKWARLPVGSSGQVLTVVNGVPTWANLPTIGKGINYYLGTAQSIPSQSGTIANINTKVFDDYSEFNTSTYTFTPLVSGKYFLALGFHFIGVGTSGDGVIFFGEIVNSTNNNVMLYNSVSPRCSASSTAVGATAAGSANLVAGDAYQLEVYQGSSASVTLAAGSYFTYFMAIRLF